MSLLRTLLLLLPTLAAILACGAARLSEITVTEHPATVGRIATLQQNAPDAECAYDLRESTPSTAVFRCAQGRTIRFANLDGVLAYACFDASTEQCQALAALLFGERPPAIIEDDDPRLADAGEEGFVQQVVIEESSDPARRRRRR